MTRYIETIRFSEGLFHHLEYHRARVLRTIPDHGARVWDDILYHLSQMPVGQWGSVMRCTVEYCAAGVVRWRAVPYTERHISRLIPVVADIDYHLKFADRSPFDGLHDHLAPDEEPLIIRDGLVTDTTFTNVVFRRPDGQLITPRTPLLHGTARARLLRAGIITEHDIRPDLLPTFLSFHLINAMRDL